MRANTKELIIESKAHGRFVVLYDAEDEKLVKAQFARLNFPEDPLGEVTVHL